MHQRGTLHEAELHYTTILRMYPDHADCRLLLGILRFQQGLYDEAVKHISAALKLQPSNIAALMNSGLVLVKLGRLEQALASYDKALALKPDHVDALVNRGNVLGMLKRLDEALASYDEALKLKPGYADALNNRGNILLELKHLDEALASYDKALALKPDYVDALLNRGNVLVELKRIDEVLASYDKALAIKPDNINALVNRGNILVELKRLDEALASYDKALALKPDYVDALLNRGNILVELKRLDEALASYDKALVINPDYVDALLNRANVLVELKRLDQALAGYDRALAIRPDHVDLLKNRGIALDKLRRFDEALASYDKALAIKPDYVDALVNRGNALVTLERLEEALASCDRALAIRPDHIEALYNRGVVLVELSRLDEAFGEFDKALAIKPDYAEALVASGLTSLRLGDFSKGWTGNEHRWQARQRKLKAKYPAWRGESISGKRVIVHEEQALGDVIQFSRYLRQLSTLGARVTFLVRPEIHRLLRTLDHTVRFIDTEPVGEMFDYECALLSLPLAFGTTLDTVPAENSYLRAEPERVAKWRERLGEEGFKIGIAWQGSKAGLVDTGRSFALLEFHEISRLAGVRLISLQKGEGVEQLRDMPPGMAVETLGDDYDRGDDAFLDAAAVMQTLDLVISSDTSIAHLAGALGRPVWLALKRVPDWRWMLDRTDSPWYPTMRLFRQQTAGDWKGVFTEIETALRQLVGGEVRRANELVHNASTPRVPVSWGELIDKITILEIKSVEIASEAARANVMKELLLLQELANSHQASEQLSKLKSDLKAVNAALWKTEDAIREKERKKEFDEEFVELARSVYRRNDQRAAIKRTIDTILASDIVEEKSYSY